MSTKSQKCTATTAKGLPCNAYAVKNKNTTLCSAHLGTAHAPNGNHNALKHGFYQRSLQPHEIADLLTHAQNITLDDELAITRVLLQRLMLSIKTDQLSIDDLIKIAPAVFTGVRTVAHLLRQLSGTSANLIWDEALDRLASDLGIQL